MLAHTGTLVIISSPSGGGKDVVIRELLKIFPNSARLITTTTRTPRPKEKNERDYYFITKETFTTKLKNNEFLEHNIYSNNYYGAEKEKLEKLLKNNNLVFTNIDVNGKKSLEKKSYPHLSVFLVPDNLQNLKKRIEKRGGLTAAQITKRMKTAEQEIASAAGYDYRVVNKEGEIGETVKQVAKIISKRILDKKQVLR